MARGPVVIRGLLHPACGPVVRVHVDGLGSVRGVGVLDTGASMSVIDRDLARELKLESPGAAEWAGVTESGERSLAALRRTRFGIAGDTRLFELDLLEAGGVRRSVAGLDVLVLLGWDFLGACRLVCDGPAGAFELQLPPAPRGAHRRR
ncbi:MAG: hypothetical protein H6737_03800 [Alphaproteobacteria bacterium]|nr:hypothetical protein [Alphaproteobacteria bacterium]